MSRDSGQATVELVALLPVVAVLAALGWQAVVAGQAISLSGAAARAAARSVAIGGDGVSAARASLPGALRAGVRVHPAPDGGVTVLVPVPAVVGGGHVGTVSARARFAPQGGAR